MDYEWILDYGISLEASFRSPSTGHFFEIMFRNPMSPKISKLLYLSMQDGLKHKQQSRENRATQRRLISSFVNDDFGDLVKFNKLKVRLLMLNHVIVQHFCTWFDEA